jgi:hypothetical protein
MLLVRTLLVFPVPWTGALGRCLISAELSDNCFKYLSALTAGT